MTTEPRGRSDGLWLRLALSLVLAAAFVFAITPYIDAVPDDPRIPPWLVVAYLGSLLPYHLLRAGRWIFLVRPLGPASWREVTLIGLAGYMWIALLPFRLGELARPLFLSQRTPITARQALGTVAIERVVDGLAICGLFFVGRAVVKDSPELAALDTASLAVMAVFGLALVTLLAMALQPAATGKLVRLLGGRISAKLADAVANTVTGVAEGLAALPSWRPLLLFCLATVAYWLVNALGMWLLATGCGVPLAFAETVVVLAVMNIALLIPGGPAQLGVFQTGLALALSLFIAPELVRDRGSVFTFYLYLCQLGTIVATGVLAQRWLRLDWRAVLRLSRDRKGIEPPPPDASGSTP